MQVNWIMHSNNYPWMKTLKSHNVETVKLLIELAVDVFNDSRQVTLSIRWTNMEWIISSLRLDLYQAETKLHRRFLDESKADM